MTTPKPKDGSTRTNNSRDEVSAHPMSSTDPKGHEPTKYNNGTRDPTKETKTQATETEKPKPRATTIHPTPPRKTRHDKQPTRSQESRDRATTTKHHKRTTRPLLLWAGAALSLPSCGRCLSSLLLWRGAAFVFLLMRSWCLPHPPLGGGASSPRKTNERRTPK